MGGVFEKNCGMGMGGTPPCPPHYGRPWHIHNKLNFNLHITKIYRSAANQLPALIRIWMFLNFEEKKMLINSYFYSNFNYCPLVWMFFSAKSLNSLMRSYVKGSYVFFMKTMFRHMRSYCKKLGKRLWK